MNDQDAVAIKGELREMGTWMLDKQNMPRHPRGFQGEVVYEDVILVVRCRDPLTGRVYICDPLELEPGKGETPEADVFLRDYATVGVKRGTSLLDVVFKLLPAVGGGSGGFVDILAKLFGGRK